MNKLDITVPKLNTTKFSKEENERYEAMVAKLSSLGINIRLYSNSLKNIQHPDGIHTFRKDATEAQRLLENSLEIPQDLLDRLAYYKPILDKELNEE